MIATWQGAGKTPSTSAASYGFVTNALATALQSAPNPFNTYACIIPLSDDIVITSITAWVETAPGASKSWAVALQTGTGVTTQTTGTFVTTAASAVISGTNTTATWNGSLPVSQGTFIDMIVTPTGTPAASATIQWVITYQTAGNFYLVPMMQLQGYGGGGAPVLYNAFFGQNSTPINGSAAPVSVAAPSALAVTKVLAWSSAQGGITGTKTYSAYNATTATLASFNSVTGPGAIYTGAVGVGSLAFAAGDLICFQVNGTGFTGDAACFTVVPSTPGEQVVAYISAANENSSSPSYEAIGGIGNNAWGTTEAPVRTRFPACTLKNFYGRLVTAPGAGKNYSLTLRTSTPTFIDGADRGDDATGMGGAWSVNQTFGFGTGINVVGSAFGITYGNVYHIHYNTSATPLTSVYEVSIRNAVAGGAARVYANPMVYAEAISGALQIYTAPTYGGTATARGTAISYNFVVNDVLAIRVDGNTYTVYMNGAPTTVTWTDAGGAIAGSQPKTPGLGIYAASTAYRFDDFTVNDILKVTIPDAALVANNVTTSKAVRFGDTVNLQSIPYLTPGATGGSAFSFLQVISQVADIIHVASTGATTNTVSITGMGLQVGDLILVKAYRGSTVLPTLPAGFTQLGTIVSSARSYMVGAKIATSTADTVGSWTGASIVTVSIYRNAAMPTNFVGFFNNTATTILSFPALTCDKPLTSWVAREAYQGTAGNVRDSTLSGYTPRAGTNAIVGAGTVYSASAQERAFDTNGPVIASPGVDVSPTVMSASGTLMSMTIEIPNAKLLGAVSNLFFAMF